MADHREYYNTENGGREERKQRRSRASEFIKWMWIGFLALGFFIFLLFLLIYNGVIGYMPPIEEIEDPRGLCL